VGAALAFKLRGEAHVAVAFFGDGATNIGTFHESMNLAQLWRVPVVFVCENNRWSESTPQSQHQPIRDLTQRASAYGMRASHVDGQDVEAVHLAALDALGHARAGSGPVFLLCDTERLTGHYIGDPQVYRDKEKLRKLRETRDPIQNLRTRLGLSDEEWARLDAGAQSVRVRPSRHGSRSPRRAQERLRGAAMKQDATTQRRWSRKNGHRRREGNR
jgi:acetoin:2,6-dichlorophenolindophenol oxidoreductase subunit alpha